MNVFVKKTHAIKNNIFNNTNLEVFCNMISYVKNATLTNWIMYSSFRYIAEIKLTMIQLKLEVTFEK